MTRDPSMDIVALRTFVEEAINSYSYSLPENAIGVALSEGWVRDQLLEFRSALVEPRWETVQLLDTLEQMDTSRPEFREIGRAHV